MQRRDDWQQQAAQDDLPDAGAAAAEADEGTFGAGGETAIPEMCELDAADAIDDPVCVCCALLLWVWVLCVWVLPPPPPPLPPVPEGLFCPPPLPGAWLFAAD